MRLRKKHVDPKIDRVSCVHVHVRTCRIRNTMRYYTYSTESDSYTHWTVTDSDTLTYGHYRVRK